MTVYRMEALLPSASAEMETVPGLSAVTLPCRSTEATAASDERLGEAVCRHLTGDPEQCRQLALAITERAIAVTNPLRDFLEEVELLD